jgi:hypothetical protein
VQFVIAKRGQPNGFIYVLSNQCMRGLVKIGSTTRPVEARVKELNSATGVPAPFKLEAYFASNNPFADEAKVHAELSSWRLQKDKEFFHCSSIDAIDAISRILSRQPVH